MHRRWCVRGCATMGLGWGVLRDGLCVRWICAFRGGWVLLGTWL